MGTKPDDSARSIHGFKWFLACASLYITCFIYGLDTTIAANIQVAVIDTFNNVEQLTWVGTGFVLGSTCTILPFAAFYAVYDLKKLFICSVVLFEAGSALCGAAPSMNALIVGRVLAGVGGSGIYLGILQYLTSYTTHKERGLYISGIGAVWGLGAVLGPVIGGAFSSSSATWRWAFYINLVIAAIFAPAYIIFLPSVKPLTITDTNALKKLLRMDWAGFVLSAGAVVSFVMVLTFAGSIWSWNDNRTISMFVVMGVLLVLTVLQQHYLIFTTTESRMVPASYILSDRSQVLLNVQTVATIANVFIPLYYIPLYFQFVHDDSSIMAAIRLLPFLLILIITNIVSGFLLPKLAYYWAIYLVSGIFMTAGGALMHTVASPSPVRNIYGYSVLLAIGSGLTTNAGFTVAGVKASLANWPESSRGKDINSAVSLQNISQVGGSLVTLLISGQVFHSVAFRNLKSALSGEGFNDAEIASATAGAHSVFYGSLRQEVKERATNAITMAISTVYVMSIVAGALSVICALAMKKEKLLGVSVADEPIDEGQDDAVEKVR